MQSVKKHRNSQPGFADLLNYAAVIDDGIVINKDGSIMAGWFYRGSDTYSATAAEMNAESLKINKVMASLGSGWMLHCDSIRLPAPRYDAHERSRFPDPVCEAIELERKHYFDGLGNSFESSYVMVLTYLPPFLAQKKIADMMFDSGDKNSKKTSSSTHADKILSSFKDKLSEIETLLSNVLVMRRLRTVTYIGDDNLEHQTCELTSYINRCITGKNNAINLPPVAMYLDSILGGCDFYSGVTPRVGDQYIIPVAITGFPAESMPAVLQALDTIDTEYRWSTRYIFMDEHESLKHLDKYRKKWKQKVRGFMDQIMKTSKGTINTDAANMAAQTESAINDVNSSLVAYGYYTAQIIINDSDLERATETAKDIVRRIDKMGFNARIETVNAVEAYLGSLPGHGIYNIRRPMINTLNLAHLLPTAAIWPGERDNPCPFYPVDSPALMQCATHGSTPFRLNLHVGDLGHTLIIGPTGAGKSTLLAIIAAQFRRYRGANIFAFDKGNSLLALTEACQGAHFDIAGENSKLAFAPLTHVHTKTERAWFEQWIEQILQLQGLVVTPLHRNQIRDAAISTLENNGRTLTDFANSVQNMEIKQALENYTVAGSLGDLLDAEHDGISLSSFTTFDIDHLMALDDKYALPVLDYLFWRVEKRIADQKGKPSILILDEAWLMLSHPVFIKKIKEWLKVLRRSNTAVIMATQSISDAAQSGILDVIKESAATIIYLPNSNAMDEDIKPVYKRMGLNDREIFILANAERKRQYYYTSANGKRLFELALGRVALAFVGASGKEDLARIALLKEQYGMDWPQQWLYEKNINVKLSQKEAA